MSDTYDTISLLDDAIVEDGIEEENPAEQAALKAIAFYEALFRYPNPSEVRNNAVELTIAWVRAGMP